MTGGATHEVVEFVAALDRALTAVLDGVVATYLHGSAALGGFVPGRSDVDVLVIHDGRPPRAADLDHAAEALHAAADPAPGRGIELSIVTARDAASPAPPWPFLLHVVTGEGDAKTVVGTGHPGDPDLLMHYAVCRAAGMAVRGPVPEELIGAISRRDILRYLHGELEWALQHAPEAYGVLNACRAVAYVEGDEIISKVAGAQHALDRGAPPGLIERALAMQRGAAPHRPPTAEARDFVTGARRVIAAAVISGPGDED